jgi:hypothetical protein
MFNFLLPQTVLCFAGLWLPQYAAIMETLQDTYQDTEGQATLFTKVLSFFVTKCFVSPANVWSDSVNMFFKKMHYDVFLKGTIGAADSQQRICMSKTATSAIDLTVEPISNAIADLTERVEDLENWRKYLHYLESQTEDERLPRQDLILENAVKAAATQLAASTDWELGLTTRVAVADAALELIAESRTAQLLVDTQGDAKPAFEEGNDSPVAKAKGRSGDTTATHNDAGGLEIVAEAAGPPKKVAVTTAAADMGTPSDAEVLPGYAEKNARFATQAKNVWHPCSV